MTRNPFISGAALALSLAAVSIAQENWNQNLVLADCGIGTNPENATWSTSRQINWYHDAIWPTSEEINPIAPDQAVEMPYGDGKYPWNFEGASAILPNGDLWSVWINDGTPEPERAGRASSPKNGGTELWCYTYRNRPISTAVSNSSSICVTAFICNHLGTGPTPWTTAPGAPVQNPPPAPPGASGSPVPPSPPGIPGPPPSPAPPGQSEPAPPSPPPPPSTPPAAELPPSPTSPSAPENARSLKVSVDLSPKPAVWLGTVDAFLSSIKVAATNICQPLPIANAAPQEAGEAPDLVKPSCRPTSCHADDFERRSTKKVLSDRLGCSALRPRLPSRHFQSWRRDGLTTFPEHHVRSPIQFHFPQDGDEFPDFVDANAPAPDLAPEEKLESQQQVKRKTEPSENNEKGPAKSLTRATAGPSGGGLGSGTKPSRTAAGKQQLSPTDDDDNGGEFYYQPESFMFLGPGAYSDVSPLGEEDDRVDAGAKPPEKGRRNEDENAQVNGQAER
ncbi:hypothetical protein VDGE_20723 [Verticillium dahliae]|uniref:Uncharacterized protein n=1 Tax=Verticillium dahliae TaxID=27337 RepID=A0A444RTN7_VERDA|nr:hypothetical protein VDGE_20723 [Verticillium dahliae]